MTIIKAENLNCSCGRQQNTGDIRDLSFEVSEGEFCALLGSPDSGVTTLLRLIDALYVSQTGKLTVCGADAADTRNHSGIRKHCGMVFRRPDRYFLRENLFDEVSYTLRCAGYEEETAKTLAALRKTGLPVKENVRIDRLDELDRIRAAIAAAIAAEPDILLVDDILTGLKRAERSSLSELLKTLNASGMTVILAAGDAEAAAEAEHIILLKDGRKLADGKTDEVLCQRELLADAGIAESFAVKCYYDLLDAGISLGTVPFSIDKLVEEVCRLS